LDEELVLDVVEVLAGAGAEFVGGREVDAGGNEKIRNVCCVNVSGPGRVVAGGPGYLKGDGVIGLGPDREKSCAGQARFGGAEVVYGEGSLGEGEDGGEAKAGVGVVGVAQSEDGVG
jgi:hypothetical protein